MWDLTVTGGHVVIPGVGVIRADIAVEGDRIASVGLRLGKGRENVDAQGRFIFPGVVDPHVHLGIQNSFASETQTETASALAGGVTTLGIFLRSLEEPYSPQLPQIRSEYEANALSDGFFHLQIFSEAQLVELPKDVAFGVTSFKFYMCGLPGVVPAVDDGFLLEAFRAISTLGPHAVACVHAENEAMVFRAMAKLRHEKSEGNLADWAESRPDEAEAEAVQRAAFLARMAGCQLYIVHLSTREGVEMASAIKATRQRVYVETTSLYLSVTKFDRVGLLGKLWPPLRGPNDMEYLWQAVRGGVIDTVGTDNTSLTRAEKKLDEGLHGSVPGGPALATHLPTLLEEGYHRRAIPLETIARVASTTPAQAFGLYPRKGTIMVGSDADLVVIDLERERRIRASDLHSFSDFSILEDRAVRGWPVTVIKTGRVAVHENEILLPPGTGRYVSRPIQT